MPRPNRGPYVKPNKRGIYEIIHYEKGRARSLSTGTRDPAKAQKALAAYILGEREIAQEGGWGVDEAWSTYWSEHVRKHVADPARLEFAWKQLEPFFGGKIIQQLHTEDFERYTQARAMWVQGPTIRRELSALTACFNYLVKTKRLKSHDLPYIPLPASSKARDRWLTAEEIEHLHATAEKRAIRQHGTSDKPRRLTRVQRFLWIVLQTGARRRVVEKLEWSRVDFGRGLIDFNFGGPQTKKRKPVVPISDALRPVLERAYAERTGPFVLDHSGSIRKAFERAVAEAKLSGVTRHTLRHTWATHASMNGVPLVDIARVLGNSLAMVTKVYAHHQPEYLRSAVNFTPKSFKPTQEKAA
jgi:integrase